jgi:hypothetical protein
MTGGGPNAPLDETKALVLSQNHVESLHAPEPPSLSCTNERAFKAVAKAADTENMDDTMIPDGISWTCWTLWQLDLQMCRVMLWLA